MTPAVPPFNPDEWAEVSGLIHIAEMELTTAANLLASRNPLSSGVIKLNRAAHRAERYQARITERTKL